MIAIMIEAIVSKFISLKSYYYQIIDPKQNTYTINVSDKLIHLSWTTMPPKKVLNIQKIVENKVYNVLRP
jgi:hypothetical protein